MVNWKLKYLKYKKKYLNYKLKGGSKPTLSALSSVFIPSTSLPSKLTLNINSNVFIPSLPSNSTLNINSNVFIPSTSLPSNLDKISLIIHNLGPQSIVNKGLPEMIVKERGNYKKNSFHSFDELISTTLPVMNYEDIESDFYLFQEWQYNLPITDGDVGKRKHDLAFRFRDHEYQSDINCRLKTLPYNYEIINNNNEKKYNIYISNIHCIVFSSTSSFKQILTGLVIFDRILQMNEDFKYVIIGGDFNFNFIDPNFLKNTIEYLKKNTSTSDYLIKEYIDEIENKLKFLVERIKTKFIILPNHTNSITNYWTGSVNNGQDSFKQGKSTCVDYYLISKNIINIDNNYRFKYTILNDYITDGNPSTNHTLMKNDFDHSPLLLELFFDDYLNINIIHNNTNKYVLNKDEIENIENKNDFKKLFSYKVNHEIDD